jgi:hypothetical protein
MFKSVDIEARMMSIIVKAKCLSLLGHGNEYMTIDSCPSELSAFLATMEEKAFSL